MAIAAHNLAPIHVGLFQENDTTSNADSDDDYTMIHGHNNNNNNNSARLHDELELSFIFLDLTQVQGSMTCDNEELSCIENGNEGMLFGDVDNDDGISNADGAIAPSSEGRETQPDDSAVTRDDVRNADDQSQNTKMEETHETKKAHEDNSSTNSAVVKDEGEIVCDTKPEDTENNDNGKLANNSRHNVNEAEFEIKREICIVYSYGKGRHRVSKRERHEKKEEKKKLDKTIDPSEAGFHFLCSRRLVLSDATIIDDDGEKGPATNATSESTTTESENVSIPVEDNKFNDLVVVNSDIKTKDTDSVLGENDEDEGNIECEDKAQDTDTTQQQQDDALFFADLGIDIHDSGSFEWGDCLDWDGVVFTSIQSSKSRSKSKPSETTSSKSGNTKNLPSVKNKNNTTIATTTTSTTAVTSYFEVNAPNYKMSTTEQSRLFSLECKSPSGAHVMRKDKHRKREKLHKAIKTSHCTILNIINNIRGKTFHIHHRVLKKANLDLDFRFSGRYHQRPMPKNGMDLSVVKAIRPKPASSYTPRQGRSAPAQNLRHVLHETNVPRVIEHDLASFLLSIQNRDLTPEDYEMLLRLDDTVKAKTVSKNVLSTLKTEPVGEDIAVILNCVICMEPYAIGQTRKFLPCGHDFHSECIDSWLVNNSQNCPLDGLPIDDS